MPGHVKLGKSGEPDPDPTPYLVVSMDMKRADMLKPYDSKKSIWTPDGQGGFKEALLESDDGTKVHCMVGHEASHYFNLILIFNKEIKCTFDVSEKSL